MDIHQYLNRIKYTGKLNHSLKVLSQLQKSHLLTTPFENLDIHYNKAINLDINKLYTKIVENNRGGFCYELNGLFYELLKELGFDVKIISARVFSNENGFGEEFDHLAIIVKIEEEEYLADVGFGEFSFTPLRLKLDLNQEDVRGNFRFEVHDDSYFRISKMMDKDWVPEYIFTMQERDFSDFSGMCRFHQTSENSHFTQKRMCSLATEDGRVTIAGDRLKVKTDDVVLDTPIADEQHFHTLLEEHFSISLNI